MGSLNNDKTVMSKPYAWRVLGCLPILKGAACTNTNKEWQSQRRLALYHAAMAPVIDEINEICSKDDYYRFADKLVREGRGFWHLLSMDGAEIAQATMCTTDNCPTCECPKAQLDNTDDIYALRDTEAVKKEVERERRRLLNADGSIKARCGEEVSQSLNSMLYNCYIACYITVI